MVMLRPIEAQLADPVAASTGQQPISYPFVVSAKTPRTLLRRAAQLAQWAREATAVDPARLAYTLGLRRTRYPHQIVVQATTVDQFADALEAFVASDGDRAGLASDPGPGLADLFSPGQRRPISLPAYPFERKSLWHPEAPADPARGLVRRIHLDEFWMRDHQLGREHVLPGVGYAELALVAALGEPGGGGRAELTGLRYHQPFVLSDSVPELDLAVDFEAGRSGAFEAASGSGATRTVHCTGLIEPGDQAPSGFHAHPDRIDVAAVFAELGEPTSGTECYAQIATTGLVLGPAFNAINELVADADRVAARLTAPAEVVADYDEYWLHPSVFDGALEIVYRIADVNQLSMPVGMDRVGYFERPERSSIAYATRSATQRPGEVRYDVSIYQLDGRRAVAVEGFAFQDLAMSGLVNAGAAEQRYTVELVAEPVGDQLAAAVPQRVALVNGARDLHAALASRATVSIGTTTPAGTDTVVIDLRDAIADSASAIQQTYTELLQIEQELLRTAPDVRQVIVVAADAGEPISRGLHAFALTVGLEQSMAVTVVATDTGAEQCAKQISTEVARAAGQQRGLVSHRGSTRSVLRVSRMAPGQAPGLAQAAGQGCFVITGGTGAIGGLVCRALANSGNHLVVLGSRAAGPRIAEQLADLRNRGASAEYHSVDLLDEAGLRALFDRVERDHGRLTGVFHLAGVTRDALLGEQDPAASAAVLAPKIGGALGLAKALRGRGAGFLLLGSSLAAVTGNVGQADYGFANGFLDGLANQPDERDDFRTLTLNWSVWRDGGIAIEANVLEMFEEAFGIVALSPEQGLRSIAAALVGDTDQTIVVAGDPVRVDQHLGVTDVPETSSASDGQLDDAALRDLAASRLRRIVIDSIKLSEADFDPGRTVQDYGYTSLTLVDLANSINAGFGTTLTPAVFFSASTVNELADHLVARERAAVSRSCRPEPARPAAAKVPPTRVVPAAAQRPVAAPRPESIPASAGGFAIVGVDVSMPGAPDLGSYWRRLVDRQCLVGTVPADRWDWRALDADLAAADQAPISHFGGFLDSVADFDRQLFGISPREAVLMDPQQRLAMESVRKTVESAGYRMADLVGARMGLFMGVATMDYSNVLQEIGTQIDAYTSTGASHSMLVNRISFANDWSGPSEPIDTACSSSLVAIHRACEAISSGSCDAAIAGGVNLIVSPLLHAAFSRAGMLSPTGLCHSFDAQADGYVRGEGVGAVFIKRLADALADGDEILATIRGTAVNHGGRATSLTAPNPQAQARVIRDAWQPSGVDVASIGYIEAHGTGTKLGDPVEIDGLREAFTMLSPDGQLATEPSCRIGTVKANIGHLEASAGIAGVAKVIMMLRNGVIPGHPTLDEVNPYINLADSPFTIVHQTEAWQRSRTPEGAEVPLRAGVSSFGFGGANAHIALEEHRDAAAPRPAATEPQILVVSGRTAEALNNQRTRLADHLATAGGYAPSLVDLGYTLREGREHREHCALFVVTEAASAELADLLRPTGTQPQRGLVWRSADFDAERDRPALQAALGSARATDLAVDYLSGRLVDWSALRPAGARRVLLPNTPLQRTRCWPVDEPPRFHSTLGIPVSAPTHPARQGLHPMLDSRDATGAYFTKRLTTDEFFLADHVVNGQVILPGAAYAEIAHAVARQLELPEQLTISNLTWKTVLEMTAEQRTMSVQVSDSDATQPGGFDLVIGSGSAPAQQEHCTCTISPELNAQPRRFDLDELRSRGEREYGRQYCYDTLYRRAGFDYGPAFQVTQSIRSWASGAVAELRLPQIAGVDDPRFVLHPSLIDGAIRAIAAIANQRHVSTYIPFFVERVEVFAACPSHCHAVAEVASDPGENIQNMAFNVSLTDQDGNECVRFTNLMVRGFAKGRDEDDTEFVLSPRWVEAASVAPAELPASAGPVLVVSRQLEHCAAVAEQLAGRPERGVIQVCHQDAPGVRAAGVRTFGDDLDADFAALWGELQAADRVPSEVLVDLTGHSEAGGSISARSGIELLRALTRGLNPLLTERCRISVVYPEGLDPEQLLPAATVGFVRSIGPVAPRLHWALLEFAAGVPFQRVAEVVLGQRSYPSGTLQRITETAHLVETMESLNDHALIGATPGLRPGSVCIITGGAGAIGSQIARLLAQKYQMKLALVGRSPMDERIAASLTELRGLGGAADYFSADVTRRNEVDRLVAAVRDRWGQVDGVVHAAGVLSDVMIFDAAPAEIERVLAAKVAGALHLDAATTDDDLDFFVAFSSVSSLIGDRGSCSYGAANSYLDALVELREKLRSQGLRSGRSLSIGWPMWAEGGMPLPGTDAQFFAETGMRLLQTAAALDIFDWMLTLDQHRLTYVHGRGSTIRRVFRVSEREAVGRSAATPAVRAAGEQAAAPGLATCIAYLKELVAQVSGYTLAEIDEHQEFEDFGIDSLMILDLNERLGADFPGLDRTIFFEYNRISRLAEYLLTERAADVERLNDPAAGPSAEPVVTEAPMPAPVLIASGPVEPAAAVSAPATTAAMASASVATAAIEPLTVTGPVVDHSDEPIAIIGMAGRFPDADSVAQFWTNLCQGRDSIIEVPPERWDHEELLAAQAAGRSSIYAKWGSFLDDVTGFDPLLFKITHADARHIDPQERLFLENVFGTLEDAGYSAFQEDPIDVGVYVGVMYGHYQLLALERTLAGAETVTSSAYASIANRASYVFNFSGPSVAVDTMCSSSLTAIHLACEALRRGDCSMAIAGGVNVTIHPDKYRFLSAQHFAATDGRCRAFGAGGDGYVPGEAVASVLLKPLSQAERDHDQILAVIRGTAINHGGKTNGYTVTNPNAQAEVIAKALRSSGISARDVSYVEAHGTGTQLGDPIEIRGLVKAFAADTDDRSFCQIGSVKSNIGHAEGAAGIVSLVKTVQQMRHRMIVPSLHSTVLNPQIDFDATPFEVTQQLQPWQPVGTPHDGVHDPLVAGVSSFGAGGSNAHIIVEQYLAPTGSEQPPEAGRRHLIPFSARNQDGLERLLAEWEAYLTGSTEPDQTDAPLAGHLVEAVADLLQIPTDQVDVNLSLDELGIDSFLSDGLTARVLERTGLEVAWAEIAHLESLADVVVHLAAVQQPAAAASSLAAGLPACRDIAFTMQRGRIHQRGARAALIVGDHAELLAGVRALRAGQTSADVYSSSAAGQRTPAEQVAELLAAADLGGLAAAHVAGARIDWAGLEAEPTARRVGLPLYPCERQPLWLDPLPKATTAATGTPTSAGPAPLVGENLSTLDASRFRIDLDPGFGAISDHVIQDAPLLPAAQYLEALTEVGRLAGVGQVQTIRNAIWKSAVPVSGPRSLVVDLARSGEWVQVRVQDDGPQAAVCFEAELAGVARRTAANSRVDVAGLRAGLTQTLRGGLVYERFAEVGMAYGELMRPIVEVHTSPSELLARLELPNGWGSNPFDLHPSLLDGAFQAVATSAMGAASAGSAKQATVPFGLSRLTIHAPIPDHCYVHVTPRSGGSFAAALEHKLAQYRIRILDPQGHLMVDIDGFSGMVIPGGPTRHRHTAPPAGPTGGSVFDLLSALEQGSVSQEHVMKALSDQNV